MTTYTYPADRAEAERGLTAVEVAHARLTHGGRTYELRQEDDGAWGIHVAEKGRYGKWGIYSNAATADAAFEEMAPVIAVVDIPGVPDALTDADYDEMRAA